VIRRAQEDFVTRLGFGDLLRVKLAENAPATGA
jgi:hypothetical protein